jgi:uncharacterized protein
MRTSKVTPLALTAGSQTGRLLERGNGHLERYAASGGPTYGLDLAEFRTRIHRVAGTD